MTGFGRGEESEQGIRVVCELRAVNHRFAEVVARFPRDCMQFEETVKRIVLARVRRGRVDVYLTVERDPGGSQWVRIDWALAEEIKRVADALADRLQMDGTLTVGELLAFPQLMTIEEPAADTALLETLICRTVETAVEDLVAMREREGGALAADIQARLSRLKETVDAMERRYPLVVEEYRVKLANKVREIVGQWQTVDEGRILTEVALLAERSNVDEEIVRVRSHIAQFEALLGTDEPVGRKLDFLLTEMNREVNTIGSKANDAFLSQKVVDAKSLLEQMREQVQNVE